MTDRHPQLDSLTEARGIAAWLIVLFHVRVGLPWLPDPLRALLDRGYLAVDFFFLLSGFVIYLSTHRSFEQFGAGAIPGFFRRRMARLYPLYAVVLTLTALFALVLLLTGRDASNYPWRELPLHVLMMQNWGFTDNLSWNHPAWSISTEFAANLLFPLVILLVPVRRMGRISLLFAALGLIGLMAAILAAMGVPSLKEDIPHAGLIRCLGEFYAGCLVSALWLRGVTMREIVPPLIALALMLTGLSLWLLAPASEPWSFPVATGALIFLMAEGSRRLAAPRMLRRPLTALRVLGEISYATYLCHFMLFIGFKILFVRDANAISPGQILLFLALTGLTSALLYRFVEQPGRALLSGRPRGAPAPSPQTAAKA